MTGTELQESEGMADRTLGLDVPADYKPSAGELDNLVYLTLRYTIGWSMRQADKAVCLMMAGDGLCGDEGISKLVQIVCEYAWDHLAGEPEDFDADDLFDHIRPALVSWYESTTPAERAITD